MNSLRAFVAIPLAHEIIARIDTLQKDLKAIPADVKWVRPESIHLTLKFLGSIDEAAVEPISRAIQKAMRGLTPWSVALRTLGTFPSLRNPRVVWIGIKDESGQIMTLQQQIENELSSIGFPKETRPFSPHLTLGRVRSSRGKRELAANLIDQRELVVGEIGINRVILFKSDLRPSGAVYTALGEYLL
ncbi:MAG: RNA 2',3'-cyclic phosphodiesterase [Deltaproteobacteria bacterium]|nr:RNA 2',3'-cyclic phosphodiesterase [Deltaproteobacteria bacterium]